MNVIKKKALSVEYDEKGVVMLVKWMFIGFILSGCASIPTDKEIDLISSDGKATKFENTFSMGYRVGILIDAPPEKIWQILTDSQDYPRWNSTVISIKGTIAPEQDIVVKSKISPERDFELEVSKFEINKQMVWEDGTNGIFKGRRAYTLTPVATGKTKFTMVENFAGIMLPMIKGSLPEFTQSFEDFSRDLKIEAER